MECKFIKKGNQYRRLIKILGKERSKNDQFDSFII